ncbi:MAG: hypothetical protein ACQESF_06600 [Nanobdellota archaeon]
MLEATKQPYPDKRSILEIIDVTFSDSTSADKLFSKTIENYALLADRVYEEITNIDSASEYFNSDLENNSKVLIHYLDKDSQHFALLEKNNISASGYTSNFAGSSFYSACNPKKVNDSIESALSDRSDARVKRWWNGYSMFEFAIKNHEFINYMHKILYNKGFM